MKKSFLSFVSVSLLCFCFGQNSRPAWYTSGKSQKVEELTKYVIDLQNQINELKNGKE